jgi:hypothetical protein
MLKWRYMISYGYMKPGVTGEQLTKDFAKYKTELEKAGIKLVFWGHPFGTAENVVAVLDVNGDMNNYLKTMSIDAPYTGTRSDTVMERT